MGLGKQKNPWDGEWRNLIKKEKQFTDRRKEGPTSVLIQKLDRFVPAKLSATLNSAFFKAFELIFNKGTNIIEKTYNKKASEANFKVNQYAYHLCNTKKSVKKFTKDAKSTKAKNLFISMVEGIGLGLVGSGLPDIPLFIGVVLKSVYQVALSFGYDYTSTAEKIFILKIIEVAMQDDEEFIQGNEELNDAIDFIATNGDIIGQWNVSEKEQMRMTSEALSKEMLYTKFIQGYFVIGMVGGVFNPVYLNRISDYAVLKYRRRFLKSIM